LIHFHIGHLKIGYRIPVDGKPAAASVPVDPPFFLNAGNAFVHMHIIAPDARGQPLFGRTWAFVFSAIPEFISVSLSANGAGQCQRHNNISLLLNVVIQDVFF
jgi:hypothetical protein